MPLLIRVSWSIPKPGNEPRVSGLEFICIYTSTKYTQAVNHWSLIMIKCAGRTTWVGSCRSRGGGGGEEAEGRRVLHADVWLTPNLFPFACFFYTWSDRGSLHRICGNFNAAVDDFLVALGKCGLDEFEPAHQEATRHLVLTYNDLAVECFQ